MEPGDIKDLPELGLDTGSEDSERLLAQEDREEQQAEIQEDIDRDNSISCCRQLSNNFKLIWKATKEKAIYMTLIFFIVRGLLIPTFDSTHYFFLIENCGIT